MTDTSRLRRVQFDCDFPLQNTLLVLQVFHQLFYSYQLLYLIFIKIYLNKQIFRIESLPMFR